LDDPDDRLLRQQHRIFVPGGRHELDLLGRQEQAEAPGPHLHEEVGEDAAGQEVAFSHHRAADQP
jgi:hypothetical protein